MTAQTPAQTAALAVIDRHAASMLSNRTNMSTNEVNVAAGRALVRAGVLEEYPGPDGAFVRRVTR